jgi:hypothetical protein
MLCPPVTGVLLIFVPLLAPYNMIVVAHDGMGGYIDSGGWPVGGRAGVLVGRCPGTPHAHELPRCLRTGLL